MLYLLAGALVAQANEVTDMPPTLRGDVNVGWDGDFLFGGLQECCVEDKDETVGRRKIQTHTLHFGAEFAPIDGIALVLELPLVANSAYSFSDAREMTFDPVAETGTYLNGDPLAATPGYRGKGVPGVWVGAAFSPFAERFERGGLVTWRIDLAYRTPSNKNLYEGPNDARGAATGKGAFRLGMAFSRDHGVSSPYMWMNWVREGNREISAGGATIEVKPGSNLDLGAGVELPVSQDASTGQRIAIDVSTGFGYRTPADVPSGFYLPDVLDRTLAIDVTRGDHLVGRFGLGLDMGINENLLFRLDTEGRYFTPHRLEHPYPVRTGLDTFELGVGFEVVGRIR